jgi:hypothetical protein
MSNATRGRFWIIVQAPEGQPFVTKGDRNKVYLSRAVAEKRARELTKSEMKEFVVLEAVSAFAPVMVQEVAIVDSPEYHVDPDLSAGA